MLLFPAPIDLIKSNSLWNRLILQGGATFIFIDWFPNTKQKASKTQGAEAIQDEKRLGSNVKSLISLSGGYV